MYLRKIEPVVFVPKNALLNIFDNLEESSSEDITMNKLAVISNPVKNNQHIAIYPSLSSQKICINYYPISRIIFRL